MLGLVGAAAGDLPIWTAGVGVAVGARANGA